MINLQLKKNIVIKNIIFFRKWSFNIKVKTNLWKKKVAVKVRVRVPKTSVHQTEVLWSSLIFWMTSNVPQIPKLFERLYLRSVYDAIYISY